MRTSTQKAVLEKTVTAQKDYRQINILTMEHIPNGSVLNHGNSKYTLCNMYVHEKCNEPYFRYIGFTQPVFSEEIYKPEYLFTTARVTNNKDPENRGRVQVDFLEFSDNDSEKIWLDYTSQFVGVNNGGCVFVPDINDKVCVFISAGKAFIINSLRVNELPDNCRDVNKKHFAVKDSVISIDDKEISLIQSDRTSFKMNADVITSTIDNSAVTLKTDSIKSETGKSVTELTSDEIRAENGSGKISIKNDIAVLTGGKSGLSLDNGKSELSGSNINLSTQGISL